MIIATKIYTKRLLKNVCEVYGIFSGRFSKRQYIGYTEKQAKEKFQQSLKKGEI